jgi:hypothetical protein
MTMLGRTATAALLSLSLLLLLAGAAADEPQPDGGDIVLHVRAFIDGASELNLWGDCVQWRHHSRNLPGAGGEAHGRGPYPTVVNGVEWFPEWRGNTSVPLQLAMELPKDLSKVAVSVEKIAVRGELSVKQTSTLLSVLLDDGPVAGADWYELKVRIGPEADSPPPVGQGAAATRQATAADAGHDSAAGVLTASSNFVVQQAHYEATIAAARQLAAARALVEEAWQVAARIQADSERIWQEGTEAQNARDYWRAVAANKRERQRYWELQGVDVGDFMLYTSIQEYYYAKYKREAEQAELERDRAASQVRHLQQEYDRLSADFQQAEAGYWYRRNAYDASFADLYAAKFAERRAALAARAREHQKSNAESRLDRLKAEQVPGTYTWMENGRELGRLTIARNGSFTAAASDYGKAEKWQIDEDGLHLSFEEAEWVFLPGPQNCLVGLCAGPALEDKDRKAMLQPEAVPAPQEARTPGAPADPRDAAARALEGEE